ncbi:MAG: DHHA1 domain-containing protein, partial [Planctomycetota bacterium]
AQASAKSEPRAPASGSPSEPEAPARDKASGGKALLLAAMSNDLIKRGLKAGDLVKAIAPLVKGGGGGPPTMAQAGGKAPEHIEEALDRGRAWIEEKLESA